MLAAAMSAGMAVMSSDATGAPRLMRVLAPRAAAIAGMAPAATARDHVVALAPLWVQGRAAMALDDAGTQRLRNGSSVVTLTQRLDGVRVDRGDLRVLLHADGGLAAISGTLLPTGPAPVFASSARDAVERALDQQYGTARGRPAIHDAGERGGWIELAVDADPQLEIESARTRRVVASVAGALTAAWETELVGDAAGKLSAGRYVITEAGALVRKTDLIHNDAFVYRAYAETTGNRRPLDSAYASVAPHPTGVPDGTTPGFAPMNLVVMDSFNGPRDPWLPSNATTTAGNNAEAFADLDGNRSVTAGDLRPEVRAGRVLNHAFDPAHDRPEDPEQSKAAAVNAFFVVNWMHDWWYDSGFTEVVGNAQRDNYGRGGVAGDPIRILAQWGASQGMRSNAFMSTPADGGSPQMRLLLWHRAKTTVTTPTGIARSASLAEEPNAFDLTGELALGRDATAPFNDGCEPLTSDVAGRIVLLSLTDECLPRDAAAHARAAGAIAMLYVTPSDPPGATSIGLAPLPALAIGSADGDALAAAIAQGSVTVGLRRVPDPQRDGDFDNTVTAHEWGHYLHRRLTECSTVACGGMGEGWGDFNALLMMLREGDDRDGVYAMAPYANTSADPDGAYFGLRRFPYSLDRRKNALSYRHISDGEPLPTQTLGRLNGFPSSEPHNTGEVWATMLWEVLNVLADEHGVPVARRRMSDYVVAGLLLTPPDATFTEARDAMLVAASALDSEDMVLIAAAFAGRGAGSCAVSPRVDAVGNRGVIESGTLAANLQVGSLELVDDGGSCDHDGYLDPGESGTLRATAANASVFAGENVTITATTSTPGVRLGAPVRIARLAPFATVELAIPVTVLAAAPRGVNAVVELRVAGDNTCTPDAALAVVAQRIGVDEVVATSRVDRVETRSTPWRLAGDGAASLWRRERDRAQNQAWFAENARFESDTQLVSPPLQVSTTEPFVLALSHAYELDAADGFLFDGAVIELSRDGGTTWDDVATLGVDPGYTGEIFDATLNPLAGRPGFGGISPGFPALERLRLDFGMQLAGETVLVRFRVGTDDVIAATGWTIDDIEVAGTVNTPFPELVNEPSTCTARQALADSVVLATRHAPATSLGSFDAAVCIAIDE